MNKEDSRDILNKGISSISKLFGDGVASERISTISSAQT
jgi:hypothetical protein